MYFFVLFRVLFDVFLFFGHKYREMELDANVGKKGSETQANGDEEEGWWENGPVAGAQVSAATRRTCASANGTDVCITPSPRYDGSDDRRQW